MNYYIVCSTLYRDLTKIHIFKKRKKILTKSPTLLKILQLRIIVKACVLSVSPRFCDLPVVIP